MDNDQPFYPDVHDKYETFTDDDQHFDQAVDLQNECLRCGASLNARRCKLQCPRCGYTEDCADAGLIDYDRVARYGTRRK